MQKTRLLYRDASEVEYLKISFVKLSITYSDFEMFPKNFLQKMPSASTLMF